MLFVSRLNCWFPDHDDVDTVSRGNRVLDDISLSVDTGQTVALVGESGSGKTVTALTILRLLEEISPVSVSGKILFENRDLLTLPLDAMRCARSGATGSR